MGVICVRASRWRPYSNAHPIHRLPPASALLARPPFSSSLIDSLSDRLPVCLNPLLSCCPWNLCLLYASFVSCVLPFVTVGSHQVVSYFRVANPHHDRVKLSPGQSSPRSCQSSPRSFKCRVVFCLVGAGDFLSPGFDFSTRPWCFSSTSTWWFFHWFLVCQFQFWWFMIRRVGFSSSTSTFFHFRLNFPVSLL